MSELKAKHVVDVYDEYSSDPYKESQVYLKSEADKVIAELEEKLKNSRNARKYWRKEYLIEYKECLHNKYKRCLAMAEQCHILMTYGPEETSDFYDKWTYIWQELAEEFKPSRAKETK